MSDMFNKYNDEYLAGKYRISNEKENLELEKEYWGEIISGASNSYFYNIDIKHKPDRIENIKNIVITYVQGTETILDNIPYTIKEYKSGLVSTNYYVKVMWEISENDSLLFNSYNRNVFGQLKIIYKDGSIVYTPLLRHAVKDNLNKGVSND